MAGPPRFSPDKILAVLMRHRVDFVLIGGLAALAHGSNIPTLDVDITPNPDVGNLDRLSAALTELEAEVRFGDEALPFSHNGESLANAGVWNLRTVFGDLNISMIPNGTQGYPDLIRDASDVAILDVVVPTSSLADVIRSKQAANRPKDQRVLPVLREILASRHARNT
ncbi:MAG TPA: hypothetical protein VFJ19_04645 [Nocardioidaceae bacterium]|nr:hypothetical protein [Nocardioidaceae bacterium]